MRRALRWRRGKCRLARSVNRKTPRHLVPAAAPAQLSLRSVSPPAIDLAWGRIATVSGGGKNSPDVSRCVGGQERGASAPFGDFGIRAKPQVPFWALREREGEDCNQRGGRKAE